MMQLYPVLFLVVPAISANVIKRLCELLKRPIQGFGLLRCRMQLDSYGSVHTESVPYMFCFCNIPEKTERRGGASSRSRQRDGFPRREYLWKIWHKNVGPVVHSPVLNGSHRVQTST